MGIVGHGILGNAVRLLLQRMGCRSINTVESSSVAQAFENTGLIGDPLSPISLNTGRHTAPTNEQEWITTVQGHDWVIPAQDSFEPEELTALNQPTFRLRLPYALLRFICYQA